MTSFAGTAVNSSSAVSLLRSDDGASQGYGSRGTARQATGDCGCASSRKVMLSIIFVEVLVVCAFLLFNSGPSITLQASSTRADDIDTVDKFEDSMVTIHPISNYSNADSYRAVRTSVVDKGNWTTVAIGCAITSNKIPDVLNTTSANIVDKFVFFKALLNTFCSTASPGFSYHFYLAYDSNDPFFSSNSLLLVFKKAFYDLAGKKCSSRLLLAIHFVRCNHAKKPAWAQNDAMIEAYIDNIDYYYRINDDTLMKTKNWTVHFIHTLRGFDPPNLGVVGPTHSGGNKKILTYDFVHRTHVDVFGFYYPRVFTDWYGDGWITAIYKPGRSVKLKHILLKHTMKLGQRYSHKKSRRVFREPEQERDMITLHR